nr:hypothetical protein [Bacilli bacterium]
MQDRIMEMLKYKLLRAKECEYAVMKYLDNSFVIPKEEQEEFSQYDLYDEMPASGRVYLWKENFLKTKGLNPFNTKIDDYAQEALAYMKATSPYCFGIDTENLMLDPASHMSAEMALYALSLGASDEQVGNISSTLKDTKMLIPRETVLNHENIKNTEKKSISMNDIQGTTVEAYMSDNLLGILSKLNDKNIANYMTYLMRSDALRNPQRFFNGVCIDSDGQNMFASEGNHRVFAYKALQAIRALITGEQEKGNTFTATISHHVEFAKA